MKTYPTMDMKITDLLRLRDDPVSLYAAARIEELEKKIAGLFADLQERDQALHVESEALGYADDRAVRLEKALERACVLITNHVNAYGTGMDLPMDLLANSRKPEAWKKYFMQEADQ